MAYIIRLVALNHPIQVTAQKAISHQASMAVAWITFTPNYLRCRLALDHPARDLAVLQFRRPANEASVKKLQYITSILLLSASAVFAVATTYEVHWQGSLRAVHGGDVSGKVPLQQFKGKKNLYAVGPVAELDGEITAIDDKIYIARVKHGRVTNDSDFSTRASFLVWSEVGAWQPSMPLGAKVENHAQLEKQVEALAAKAGIDTSSPFPFKLEGVFDSVDYHVLVPKTHQAQAGHSDGAKKISAKMADAEIVGFFSKNHEGVFTHKGSTAHLHVVERNGNSGHVDQIGASANVRVSFPQ